MLLSGLSIVRETSERNGVSRRFLIDPMGGNDRAVFQFCRTDAIPRTWHRPTWAEPSGGTLPLTHLAPDTYFSHDAHSFHGSR